MTELFKLTYDLSYYFALAGYFYACFTGRIPMKAYLLLTGMIAADVVLRQLKLLKKPARAVAVSIPLAIFFMDLPASDIIFSTVPYIYIAISIFTDRVFADRYDFRNETRLTIRILPVIVLGFFVPDRAFPALEEAVPYIIIMLYSMIWLLRYLRSGEHFEKNQLVSALGMVAVTLLCTIGKLPELMVKGFVLLYEHVLSHAIGVFATAFGAVIYGIGWFFRNIFLPSGFNEIEEFPSSEAGSNAAQAIENVEPVNAAVLEWIAKILGILIIAAALVFIMYKLLGKRRPRSDEGTYSEHIGEAAAQPVRKRLFPRLRPMNPRETVRHEYAKFLKEAKKRGVEYSMGATTSEIAEKSLNDFPPDPAWELRDLYVVARYAPNEEITREQASKSAAAYKKLKNSKRSRTQKVDSNAEGETN